MYQGKAISLSRSSEGIVELTFDLQGESVNKFNLQAVTELDEVLNLGDRIAVIDSERWSVLEYWTTGRQPDALGFAP